MKVQQSTKRDKAGIEIQMGIGVIEERADCGNVVTAPA